MGSCPDTDIDLKCSCEPFTPCVVSIFFYSCPYTFLGADKENLLIGP